MGAVAVELGLDGIRSAARPAAPAQPVYNAQQQALIDQAQEQTDFDADIELQNQLNKSGGMRPSETDEQYRYRVAAMREEIRQRKAGQQAERLSRRVEFGGQTGTDEEARNLELDELVLLDEMEKEKKMPGYLAQRQLLGATVSELYPDPDKSRFYGAQVPEKK
jgi:hypothetical protein